VPPNFTEQTRDVPKVDDAAFQARIKALFDAVQRDAPEAAAKSFFPEDAYAVVKAVGNPRADYKNRLVAAYNRDIHALHDRHKDAWKSATFVRIDVPMAQERWVNPNEESNKIGYHRVFHSQVVYELAGKERSFEIRSLISWRGQWYVVHLSGMK
jgi:hypothetical protein